MYKRVKKIPLILSFGLTSTLLPGLSSANSTVSIDTKQNIQTLNLLSESAEGTLASWVLEGAATEAGSDSFSWIISLMGLGGSSNNAQVLNELSQIQQQLQAIQNIVQNNNLMLQSLTSEVTQNFENEDYTNANTALGNLENKMQNTMNNWSNVLSVYAKGKHTPYITDPNINLYTFAQSITPESDDFIQSAFLDNEATDQNYLTAANSELQDFLADSTDFSNLTNNMSSVIQTITQTAVPENQNLAQRINAYNILYFTSYARLLSQVQYAYNIQAFAIALFYTHTEYAALKDAVGLPDSVTQVMSDTSQTYADAIDTLNNYYNNGNTMTGEPLGVIQQIYNSSNKTGLYSPQAPLSIPDLLAASNNPYYPLSVTENFRQSCQIVSMTQAAENAPFKVAAVCQDLPSGKWQTSCSDIGFKDGVISATCTDSQGNAVTNQLNLVQSCYQNTPVYNDNGILKCVAPYGNGSPQPALTPTNQIYIPNELTAASQVSLALNNLDYIKGFSSFLPQNLDTNVLLKQSFEMLDLEQLAKFSTPQATKTDNTDIMLPMSVNFVAMNFLDLTLGTDQGRQVQLKDKHYGFPGSYVYDKFSYANKDNPTYRLHDHSYTLTQKGHLLFAEIMSTFSWDSGYINSSITYRPACLKNDNCEASGNTIVTWQGEDSANPVSDVVSSYVAAGDNLYYYSLPMNAPVNGNYVYGCYNIQYNPTTYTLSAQCVNAMDSNKLVSNELKNISSNASCNSSIFGVLSCPANPYAQEHMSISDEVVTDAYGNVTLDIPAAISQEISPLVAENDPTLTSVMLIQLHNPDDSWSWLLPNAYKVVCDDSTQNCQVSLSVGATSGVTPITYGVKLTTLDQKYSAYYAQVIVPKIPD